MNRTDEVEKYRTFISQQPEFSALSSVEFDQLTTTLRIKSFGKGQVLFDQGDTRDRLYYVLEGVVRLERLDETGNFPFINYVSPYKAFPYRGFFQDKNYTYSAAAMTPITIASFSMASFESVVKQNGAMMVRLITKMGQIINETEDRLQKMVTSSATHRIKQALVMFGEDLGDESDQKLTEIPYPITLKELAWVSGTTRETAGQVVSKLVEEGKVNYQHKTFQFDPASLNE